jgi:hypothetical protein
MLASASLMPSACAALEKASVDAAMMIEVLTIFNMVKVPVVNCLMFFATHSSLLELY